MIKQFKDYATTKGYSDYEALPKGAYVMRILGVEMCTNSIGEYIKIGMDVAEGEYKDFYMNDWKGQQGENKTWRCNYLLNIPTDDGSEKDGWTKRRFKTFTDALEESNDGYHFDWDEQKFKGKLIGGLFNIREYEKNDGSIGSATNLAQVTTVQKVREGKYKLPADKLIQRTAPASTGDVANMDFMKIPDTELSELPF